MQIILPIHKIVKLLKRELSNLDESQPACEFKKTIVALFEKKDRTEAENKILHDYEYKVNYDNFQWKEKEIRLRNMSQGLRSR